LLVIPTVATLVTFVKKWLAGVATALHSMPGSLTGPIVGHRGDGPAHFVRPTTDMPTLDAHTQLLLAAAISAFLSDSFYMAVFASH
jgi:hypothetical protein